MKYPCCSCDRKFPFESDLVNHRLKHQRNPGFMCNHELKGGICGKWFYAKSDLTKHMKIRTAATNADILHQISDISEHIVTPTQTKNVINAPIVINCLNTIHN